MSANVLFRINRPHVISQAIDDEVVVISLQTGNYYSLTGTAAAIWNAVEWGGAVPQITDTLAVHFTDCEAGLRDIVNGFLDELRAESLIVPAEPADLLMANHVLKTAEIKREKFIRPSLKKFTDMQELLLLDPIHEVDATGWPLAKSNPSNDTGK